MSVARACTVLLSFCLLLSGCTSAARWAEKSHDRVTVGMSTQDVAEEIGDPAQIVRGDQGQAQSWRYLFEGGPSTAAMILFFFVFIPLFILMALGKGGSGSVSVGGSGGSEPSAEFTVDFNNDGRVISISPIRLIPH